MRIALALALGICTVAGAAEVTSIVGESLVLDKTVPGTLWLDDVIAESVTVRSKYLPDQEGCIVYESGRDYVIDAEAGTIARTPDSRIPDFSTNVLYGQVGFDHSQFPGYGNTPFFVFVDYQSRSGEALCTPTDQSDLLGNTRKKLDAGGPFKVIVYGDSISAGGEATTVALQFSQRYAAHLQERFPQAAIEIENGATGGDSTRNGLARLEEKVLTRNPDLVLLGFGMNDHNVGGVPLDEFKQNLVTIVNSIREKTGAELILFSTFPPNPDWKFGSGRMGDYAAATRDAATAATCAFADVYGPWTRMLQRKDCQSLLGNNINHPNDFGHWIYFEALKSVQF
jgi:lysophospholipase L1-like esterase